MIVSIHQPNYLPWLGYFAKLAASDIFVFLDDAQYSKNSYINRVGILADGQARWLSVPVSQSLGDPISAVRPARADWARAHQDRLRQAYRRTAAFAEIWPEIADLLTRAGAAPGLAAANRLLVEGLAARLDVRPRFLASSDLDLPPAAGDDRLVAIVQALAPGGTYLSGRGGAGYQDPEKFRAAGLGLRYTDFRHPIYDQGGGTFVPGLSVIDALFRLGWRDTARLIREAREPPSA